MKYLMVILGISILFGSCIELLSLFFPEFLPATIRESKSIIFHQENKFVFYWTAFANLAFFFLGPLLAFSGLKLFKKNTQGHKLGFQVSAIVTFLTFAGFIITSVTVLPILINESKPSGGGLDPMSISIMGSAAFMPIIMGWITYSLHKKMEINKTSII